MNKIIILWLACYFFICSMAGQSLQSDNYQVLASKLAGGDRSSIYEAGGTGDQRFIPILQEIVRRQENKEKPLPADYELRGLDKESIAGAARLALAKLGDKEQQQKVFCDVYSKNIDIHLYATEIELPYIGGWFRTNILGSALSEHPENQIGWSRSDVVYPNLRRYAVSELRRLFPDGPAPKEPEGLSFGGLLTYQEDASKWQQWIEDHEQELMKLKPAGSYSYQDCPPEPLLSGKVLDSNGNPIANARFEVEWDTARAKPNEEGGLRFTLTTHDEGTIAETIPPGPYRVCAKEVGYFQECQKIRLESGREAVLNISLARDTEYSRAALQFLLDAKRFGTQAEPARIKKAFYALSRDSSYAGALVGLLDFEGDELGTREIQYPAIGALAVIGKPAVSYLIGTVKESDNDLIRMNAAHALGLIHRTCEEDVVAQLESEAAAPNITSEQQARLRVAQDYIAHLHLPCIQSDSEDN
ncbi:MAG: carboxypeptidase-like regulatory domain-containing protein [Acidobacteriia bacterium]|nr:carboxypeptidase-like regulatory domain-containing protein [Terriglobia bacterium]